MLALELLALGAFGFIVARVVLHQDDHLSALAQGLVIGPALWGLTINFVLHVVPGLAGTLLVWLTVLAVGVWLARRAPAELRLPVRTVAAFAAAALALFWIALASRQLLMNPDPIHLALAASIQAGNWPPTLPWNPDQAVPYHYAVALLIGLLTPPVGPDLPFTSELMGTYAWTSFVLIVVTTLAKRGGWISVLVLTPLLLTAGAWGLVIFTDVPSVLKVLVPNGLPSAGLRASLAEVYLPTVALPWAAEIEASPANIWRPGFVLAYALAIAALERIVANRGQGWSTRLTVASLLGFLGLVDEAVALVVLGLWMVVEAGWLLQARPARAALGRLALRAATGPTLAALLLAVGGGVISGVLTGSAGGGLSLGWTADADSRQPLGLFVALAGGIGLLGIGPAVVAGVAAGVARRDLLPMTLAGASAGFLLAAFILQYEFAEHDVVRLDGHARNFALLALLLAVGRRLSALRARWRIAAAALIAMLVTWPTVATPLGKVALAVGNGVQIGNAEAGADANGEAGWYLAGRQRLVPFGSDVVTVWIREHTAPDARVLSPHPHDMTANTGRPNASGFTGFVHLFSRTGPEYEDAIAHLEPAALRSLGIAFVHAPDAWAADLPDHAASWLANSEFFELVVRGEADALFRVLPAFLRLDSRPAAGSFEALRQAVPARTGVYLSRELGPLAAIRVASALSHAHMMGEVSTANLHPLTRFDAEPLADQSPEIVVASTHLPSTVVPSDDGVPIWRNDQVAVYAVGAAIVPLMPPPAPPLQTVALSRIHVSDEQIDFAATFANPTSERWTSQDWVVLDADASLWEVLKSLESRRDTPWFGGQIDPKPGSTTFNYQFHAAKGQLLVLNADGTFARVPSSGNGLGSGVWLLIMRLRDDHRKAHLFPLLKFEILADGSVRYEADGVVPNGDSEP